MNVFARNRRLFLLALLWSALILCFAVWRPMFFASTTVLSVLQFSTILALVTLGQSGVILCGGGGIDLSVGGMVSLSGVAMAFTASTGLGSAGAVAAGLAGGVCLGLFNGCLVIAFRIVPLIATLGTLFVYSGLALALTDGAPMRGMSPGFASFGRAALAVFPLPFLILVLPGYAVAGGALALTPVGRWIYAMGANETAARLVGLPVDRVRFWAYAFSGLFAGVAAVFANSWLLAARPNIGANLELESLTAALLGGVAVSGGAGGVIGPLLAVLFLVALKTGFQLAAINSIWQVGTIGFLLIASVLIDKVAWRMAWRR